MFHVPGFGWGGCLEGLLLVKDPEPTKPTYGFQRDVLQNSSPSRQWSAKPFPFWKAHCPQPETVNRPKEFTPNPARDPYMF